MDVFAFIAADSPRAAARIDDLFGAAAERLGTHPSMGRVGAVPGTREVLVHESWKLVYEVGDDVVSVVAVVHTARRWPPVRDEHG